MAETVFTSAVASGDSVTFTFTLEGSGSIAGGTVTASIREQGATQNAIADHACTITDGPNRVCTLVLTTAESARLAGFAGNPRKARTYVGDVKLVLSGVTTRFGPWAFPVRSAVTA